MAHLARLPWYEVATGALFLLASFYAFYVLTESPPTWYDEGLYIQVAQSISERGNQTLQVAPGEYISSGFITGGYPFLAPVALSLSVLGDSLFSARLPMALFILLFLCAAWGFVYKAFGREAALLSLLLLATLPLIYGNGKNVLGEVPGLFFLTISLYFLWRIEARNFAGVGSYIGAGLAAGLAVATKPLFLLLPGAIALALLFRFRSVSFRFREIAAAGIAFALPVALWLFLQFGVGDRAGATLAYYANPYGIESLGEIILGNALRFATEATPLYCAAFMLLWLAAFLLRLIRRERILLAEWTALAFSLLVLAAYLRTAGWYRYLFPALVLALLFAPSNLATILDALRRFRPSFGSLFSRALLIGACLGVGLLQLYQLNYSSWVAEHYESTAARELDAYFSMVSPGETLFVYNVPEAVPFIRSESYYQYIATTETMVYGAAGLAALREGIPDRVIVSASDYAREAPLFARYIPAGQLGSYLSLARK
ncbi:MAG TPA: glycosyltransferase family 39 protein [Candidatus Paceibacterota bacterium]|nr:glycosyltransferase family 39 protein [Candidatus Paceibacterota bacterium]